CRASRYHVARTTLSRSTSHPNRAFCSGRSGGRDVSHRHGPHGASAGPAGGRRERCGWGRHRWDGPRQTRQPGRIYPYCGQSWNARRRRGAQPEPALRSKLGFRADRPASIHVCALACAKRPAAVKPHRLCRICSDQLGPRKHGACWRRIELTITGLLLNRLIGAAPTLIPYGGTGPAMNALIAGQVDYMCDVITNALPQIEAGTIKAYLIATPERSAMLPSVPTSAEAGIPVFL